MNRPESINAVELCPIHRGDLVEYVTVVTPETAGTGRGEVGDRVTYRGVLVAVSNGLTCGRSYSKIAIVPEGGGPRVTSVLGSHHRVTILAGDE